MFIRVKKVKKRNGKTYEYAHLVSGIWKRKQLKNFETGRKFVKYNNSKHLYSKFLGRAYKFPKSEKNIQLEEFVGGFQKFVENEEINNIYKKLLEFELAIRGFANNENVWMKDGVFLDLNRLIVHDGKSDAVIKLKEVSGYLCYNTLQDLFKINKIENKYEGIYLMKKLKSIGISLSPEHFFILADRLLKENAYN